MPTNLGQLTLADWFGSPAAGLGALLVLFAAVIYLIGIFWNGNGRADA